MWTTSQTQTSEEVTVEILRINTDQFKGDPEGIKLYTVLEDYKTLGPAAYHLNYLYGKSSINVENQLILALIKWRMYKTNAELSCMFRETEVYSIFVTWITFMSLQWKVTRD